MSENVYNAGLPARRQMGGGTITPSVSETSGLTRTRHFGSASSVVNSISQAASLVRPRTLYNDHLAVWTSGVYVRLDLPATPISLQDRADPSRWVFQVTNTGSATFKGSVSGAGFVGGSIDIPSVGGTGFHVDSSGNFATGATSATDANAPFSVTVSGTITAHKDIHLWRDSAFGDTNSQILSITGGTQGWGFSSGSGAEDAYVIRTGVGIIRIRDVLRLDSVSAPAAPAGSATNVYNNSGTLFWKNATTTYNLSKTLDNALTGDVTTVAGGFATTLAAGNAGNLNSGTLLAARMPAHTGDVTSSAGSVALTIANDAVVYAKMQNVSASSRILGRKTAGAGDPEELTGTDVGGMMVATDLPTHGAAQHTDVTRSVWIPAPMFLSLAGTAASVGTTPNAAAVYQLATGATQGFGFVFRLPDDAAVVAPTYYIYWEGSTTEASKIIDFRRTYLDVTDTAGNLIDAGGTTNTHATSSASITAKQPNVTASNTLVPVGSVVAGDLYRIVMRRFTGGSDTYGGTVEVIGVLVQYTATG